MKVRIVPSNDLTEQDWAQLALIVERAFDVKTRVSSLLSRLKHQIANVILVREGRDILAFQFYQSFDIDGVRVHHLGLSAKRDQPQLRGVQKRIGRALVRRNLKALAHPGRPFALIGICNNPKTYSNFLAFGDHIFPDVRAPSTLCAVPDLYAKAAERLRLDSLDRTTGLLPGRAESVGLFISTNSFEREKNDPVFEGYRAYVDGNFQTGVFTMVSSTPWQIALKLARQFAKFGRKQR
jgi:hypothetical protein